MIEIIPDAFKFITNFMDHIIDHHSFIRYTWSPAVAGIASGLFVANFGASLSRKKEKRDKKTIVKASKLEAINELEVIFTFTHDQMVEMCLLYKKIFNCSNIFCFDDINKEKKCLMEEHKKIRERIKSIIGDRTIHNKMSLRLKNSIDFSVIKENMDVIYITEPLKNARRAKDIIAFSEFLDMLKEKIDTNNISFNNDDRKARKKAVSDLFSTVKIGIEYFSVLKDLIKCTDEFARKRKWFFGKNKMNEYNKSLENSINDLSNIIDIYNMVCRYHNNLVMNEI